MRITPKISVRPLASRNSSAPYDTPLNVWISQKFASKVLLLGADRVAFHAMKPLDRIAYSPITTRKPLRLPGGARMVVWTIVNVEEWDIDQPMPPTVLTPPAGGSPMPDIPNWAWHEYGNRVGFWRFIETLDSLKVKAALAINGTAVRAYEPIAHAALERGWEFMGHV